MKSNFFIYIYVHMHISIYIHKYMQKHRTILVPPHWEKAEACLLLTIKRTHKTKESPVYTLLGTMESDQDRGTHWKTGFICSIIHRSTCLYYGEILERHNPLLIISWTVLPLELCYSHSFSCEKYFYILQHLLQ